MPSSKIKPISIEIDRFPPSLSSSTRRSRSSREPPSLEPPSLAAPPPSPPRPGATETTRCPRGGKRGRSSAPEKPDREFRLPFTAGTLAPRGGEEKSKKKSKKKKKISTFATDSKQSLWDRDTGPCLKKKKLPTFIFFLPNYNEQTTNNKLRNTTPNTTILYFGELATRKLSRPGRVPGGGRLSLTKREYRPAPATTRGLIQPLRFPPKNPKTRRGGEGRSSLEVLADFGGCGSDSGGGSERFGDILRRGGAHPPSTLRAPLHPPARAKGAPPGIAA